MEKEIDYQQLENLLDQAYLTSEFSTKIANIAFQPTSDTTAQQNFEKTIKKPVPFSVIKNHISPNEAEELLQMYNGGDIPVWGVKEGKNGATKKQYDKLLSGDIVLFYKEWNFYCKGIVTYKVHSPQLSQALWDDPAFEHIYFLTNIDSCKIPVELVNETLYGKKERFPIMGFRVLTPEQSELIINKIGLETEPQLKDISEEEYKAAIKLNIDKPLDTLAKRLSRVEQGYLRKLLFGKKLYSKCACCGHTYPVSHLYTAHIKKRSHCDVDEKLDPHIVMPMCKFGCDTLFEDGYISVDSNGRFIRLDKITNKKVTPRIEEILNELDGRKCDYWNEKTKKYFQWHYNFHSKM